jgi:TATA-box binding protein (TBP) (component of TFIID and TFIIIB)
MDDEAISLMQEFRNTAAQVPATLTTMTILIKVADASSINLDLQNIKDDFLSEASQRLIKHITGDSEEIRLISKKVFHNALTFKCCDKQAVKIFTNGNMHMTGIKDIMDAVCLADVFAAIIGCYGPSPRFAFDIQLANFCHVLADISPNRIDLSKLESALKSKTPYSTFYNTERHAGIIIRAVDFSVLVFDSGNTIISSLTTPQELQLAGEFIKAHLAPLAQECVVEASLYSPTHKRKFDYAQYLVLK